MIGSPENPSASSKHISSPNQTEESKSPSSPSHPSQSLSSSNSHQTASSIFCTISHSRTLFQYLLSSNSFTFFDLSSSIPHNFQESPACLLPSGCILIAGGSSPYHGHTYLITLTFPLQCTQLQDLHYPRSITKLISHGDYIYALGGFHNDRSHRNKAERMDLSTKSWTRLPDMRHGRYDFGVYISRNRIYCIGGGGRDSIEYYDIDRNSFNLVRDVLGPCGGVVCGVIDERVYAVGERDLRVYSKEMKLEEVKKNVNFMSPNSMADVVVRGRRMVYVNYREGLVFGYDAGSKSVIEINTVEDIDI